VRLLLIRHGQTPSNVLGLLDTDAPGPGLTDLGHEQAARIHGALDGFDLDGIYVSRLQRTHLTAAPLAAQRGLEPVLLPGIHEIEAGDLEKRSDRASIHTYVTTAFAWGTGDLSPRMPGGADGSEFFTRFDDSLAAVEAAGHGSAALVSHGAAIRVWVAGRATNVPPIFAGRQELDNTGIVELEGSMAEGWRLLAWQGTPVGGEQFSDDEAEDPIGDKLAEADLDRA
jgi:broad specificity phosphatase PhoE